MQSRTSYPMIVRHQCRHDFSLQKHNRSAPRARVPSSANTQPLGSKSASSFVGTHSKKVLLVFVFPSGTCMMLFRYNECLFFSLPYPLPQLLSPTASLAASISLVFCFYTTRILQNPPRLLQNITTAQVTACNNQKQNIFAPRLPCFGPFHTCITKTQLPTGPPISCNVSRIQPKKSLRFKISTTSCVTLPPTDH